MCLYVDWIHEIMISANIQHCNGYAYIHFITYYTAVKFPNQPGTSCSTYQNSFACITLDKAHNFVILCDTVRPIHVCNDYM